MEPGQGFLFPAEALKCAELTPDNHMIRYRPSPTAFAVLKRDLFSYGKVCGPSHFKCARLASNVTWSKILPKPCDDHIQGCSIEMRRPDASLIPVSPAIPIDQSAFSSL